MIDRLAEDHIRAKRLADGLANIPGIILDTDAPHTNMVFLNLSSETPYNGKQIAERLAERGVLVGVTGKRRFRLVTHCWIDDAAVETAVQCFAEALD